MNDSEVNMTIFMIYYDSIQPHDKPLLCQIAIIIIRLLNNHHSYRV